MCTVSEGVPSDLATSYARGLRDDGFDEPSVRFLPCVEQLYLHVAASVLTVYPCMTVPAAADGTGVRPRIEARDRARILDAVAAHRLPHICCPAEEPRYADLGDSGEQWSIAKCCVAAHKL